MVVQFINHLISVMPSAGLLSSIGVVVEVLLRLIPSQKPMSILLMVQSVAHALVALLGALSSALDAVIPQKLSPPQA